mmetsp:Transcript_12066/g.18231  ORF Transcript_12066/g.18231 Transcript_12066/m.18231 type:complete len:301 (+) Transcript_12066:54-956(+)
MSGIPRIIPRHLGKDQKPFKSNEPEFWAENSQTVTDFIHSMSALFPEGEAFFVRAVRRFADDSRLKQNDKLCTEVKAFIAQEAQHAAEHSSYNKKIQGKHNHDMDGVNFMLQKIFYVIEHSPLIPNKAYGCLGITCSLEHLTASLAEILLTTPEGRYLIDSIAPSHRALWVWHAIEETEHKAVAYDVYCEVGGWYLARVYRHLLTTVIFIAVVVYLNVKFMLDHKNGITLSGVRDLFRFLFIYPGFFTMFIPMWFDYMRPGFHPWSDLKEREKMREAIRYWSTELNLRPAASKSGDLKTK